MNEDDIKVYYKDCRDMSELPDKSVQCVVTSPPYYGLRDYGLEPLIWGGDKNCKHEWSIENKSMRNQHRAGMAKNPATASESDKRQVSEFHREEGFCKKCGSWLGSLGLEPTPELFIEHLVEIFREVWRVLRDDGTVWLNLGDTYARDGTRKQIKLGQAGIHENRTAREALNQRKLPPGLKEKDLIGIPWRVAFALQADGWYLRSDVIWDKSRCCMPESQNGWRWEKHRIKVNNIWQDCSGCDKCNPNDGYVLRKGSWRCTKAHEYIFQLTKSDKYYSDADAVRETIKESTIKRSKYGWHGNLCDGHKMSGIKDIDKLNCFNQAGANKRDVWHINLEPYKGSHFAVFPSELPRICILASTSLMACNICGAPFARVIDIQRPENYNLSITDKKHQEGCGGDTFQHNRPLKNIFDDSQSTERIMKGWRATCKCKKNNGTGKCIVLDMFCGSGTSLWTAHKLGRRAIGYELNKEYKKLIDKRCHLKSRDLEGFF